MKRQAACGYLAVGVGIGAALSVFVARKSGEETRKWVANKCFDAIDSANEKVWQSRLYVRDTISRGQQEISKAVAAGREAFGEQEEPESSASVVSRAHVWRVLEGVMLHQDYFFLILITFGVYLMLQFYGMGGHFRGR